jgi:DNA-binding response OmpR family regulator
VPVTDVTPPPAALLRHRVLVVDDEPAVRAITKLMLEAAGFAVTDVADAATAERACSEPTDRPFAVILLDLTLPDRCGTDLLPDLRRASPRSRVVLTSGRPEEDVPEHGADSYLPKPFTRDKLITAVRTATEMPPM